MANKSDDSAAFGAAVRSLRAQMGLTQEELADRSGIDRSYIGGVERGERNPTIVVVVRIARGFGLTLSELFAYDNRRGK